MNDKTIITISAVACISMIEIVALSQGINGTVLTASIGTLALIVGYNFPGKEKIKSSIEGIIELTELAHAMKEEMKGGKV